MLVASPPRRVLLVEDVELNRVLIAEMLRSYGHEVAAAENGQEAVTLAAREPFDVVLMDVQMPVMDGVEATRQIRRLPPPAGAVPILALSANVIAGGSGPLSGGGHERRAHQADRLAAIVRGSGKVWPCRRQCCARQSDRKSGQRAGKSMSRRRRRHLHDPPLDDAVFERLQRVQGSGDLSAKLAEIFVRDTARRLEELRDAVRRADAAAVAQIAHAIKGSAANLGAQTMVQICVSIEANAKAADLGAAAARVDALQHEFTRAREALAAKLTMP